MYPAGTTGSGLANFHGVEDGTDDVVLLLVGLISCLLSYVCDSKGDLNTSGGMDDAVDAIVTLRYSGELLLGGGAWWYCCCC